MKLSKVRKARIILAIQQSLTFELGRVMVGVGTAVLFLLFIQFGIPLEIGFAITAAGSVFVGIVVLIVWGIRDAKKLDIANGKEPPRVTREAPAGVRSDDIETLE